MLGDILGEIVGRAIGSRIGDSPRTQVLFRFFFGLLGTVLAAIAIVYFVVSPPQTANVPFLASTLGLYVFLGCFSLFNIAFALPWRWPGFLFVVCLVMMFVTRIAFGR